MSLVEENTLGTCYYCAKIMLKAELPSHFKICINNNTEKPFKCRRAGCNQRFASRAYVRFHEFKHHNPYNKTIPCPVENCEAIVSKSILARHIKRIHSQTQNHRTYECPKCTKIVKDLKRHLENACSDDPSKRIVLCTYDECTAVFQTNRGRRKHELSFHGPMQRCDYKNCNYYGKHLTSHVTTVHRKISVTCDLCNTMLNKTSMKSHREICVNRGGEKTFACTHEGCTRVFATEVQRRAHFWNSHQPPVICPKENCCAIVTHGYLSTHIKLMHDETYKKARCEICDKSLHKRYMGAHMRRVHARDSDLEAVRENVDPDGNW